MKKLIKSIFLMCVVLVFTVKPLFAQGVSIEDSVATLRVQGLGKVTARPDEASVVFGVTAEEKLLTMAYKTHTASMNKVIGVVKKFGIEEADIQTSSYRIQPMYSRERQTPGQRIKPTGYRVTHQITAKVRDLSRVGDLIDKVMDEGVTTFNGIQFGLSNQQELQLQAKLKAIEDARKKAELMAKGLDVRLGRVLKVDQALQNEYPSGRLHLAMAGAQGGPQIESGSLDVTSSCDVIFEILE